MQIRRDCHAKLIFGTAQAMVTQDTTTGYRDSDLEDFNSPSCREAPQILNLKKKVLLPGL